MRELLFPASYQQGPGVAYSEIKKILHVGTHPVIIFDEQGFNFYGKQFVKLLKRYGCIVTTFVFNDALTQDNIEDLLEQIDEVNSDLVIGFGGFQTINTTKVVSDFKKLPEILIPTEIECSNVLSPFSIIYSNELDDKFCKVEDSPSLVLVDSTILMQDSIDHFKSAALKAMLIADAIDSSQSNDKLVSKRNLVSILSENIRIFLSENYEEIYCLVLNDEYSEKIEEFLEVVILQSGICQSIQSNGRPLIYPSLTVFEIENNNIGKLEEIFSILSRDKKSEKLETGSEVIL